MELGVTKKYVKRALQVFVRGDYLEVDHSRGKNHFRVLDTTLQEEDAYLKCWLAYHGRLPKSIGK
jgi:hypothetical protein